MTKPPIDYIDTQGLSPKMSPEETAKWKAKGGDQKKHKPMEIKPHRLHTDMLVKELKILINEVLDEREGKKGISYFDTDKFKYRVGEQDPPYEKWV